MLFALTGLHNTPFADFLDEIESHVSHCGALVQASLLFHLKHDMVQHLKLVLIKFKLLGNELVALDELAGCEPHGKARHLGMVLDKVHNSMKSSMDGTSVLVGITEILPQWPFLKFTDVVCMAHQLINTLVLGC